MIKINKIGMNWLLLIISIILINGSGCRKLVEAPIPSELLADENVYSIDAASIAVLNDIYTGMNANDQAFQGVQSVNLLMGLSADELTLYSGYIGSGNFYDRYYANNLSQSFGITLAGAEQWSNFYNYIFKCNAAIEGLSSSKADNLTPVIKQQLINEAKFLRAFFYFYLVNMYGDVPLATTSDPEVNVALPRVPKELVYQQIITDLKESEALLSNNFVALASTSASITTERVRPTKWAASALLARVYLYKGEFEKAETQASLVINNNALFGPLNGVSLNSVFLKNSREAIWQLQPTDQYFNTTDAQTLVIPAQGPSNFNPVYLGKQWLNNFEAGDQRKVFGNWVDTTIYNLTPTVRDTVAYCYKYKKNLQDQTIFSTSTVPGYTKMSEYFMVLRLGEQYLIRAEARAQQGNVSGAQADLNAIRNRAGLPNTTAGDQSSLLSAILKERQVELFCEWGNRWLDLRRTGKIDQVMNITTPLKSNGINQWRPYQALYPILLTDMQRNPNLIQNPGY